MNDEKIPNIRKIINNDQKNPEFSADFNEIDQEISMIDRDLKKAASQRKAHDNGQITTCVFYDTQKLLEKRDLLQLIRKNT